jgi:hypothetical protein
MFQQEKSNHSKKYYFQVIPRKACLFLFLQKKIIMNRTGKYLEKSLVSNISWYGKISQLSIKKARQKMTKAKVSLFCHR